MSRKGQFSLVMAGMTETWRKAKFIELVRSRPGGPQIEQRRCFVVQVARRQNMLGVGHLAQRFRALWIVFRPKWLPADV